MLILSDLVATVATTPHLTTKHNHSLYCFKLRAELAISRVRAMPRILFNPAVVSLFLCAVSTYLKSLPDMSRHICFCELSLSSSKFGPILRLEFRAASLPLVSLYQATVLSFYTQSGDIQILRQHIGGGVTHIADILIMLTFKDLTQINTHTHRQIF